MDGTEQSGRLSALGTPASLHTSKAARLRHAFDSVEGSIGAWNVEELNRDGFNMTMASFKSVLQRICLGQSRMHADRPRCEHCEGARNVN